MKNIDRFLKGLLNSWISIIITTFIFVGIGAFVAFLQKEEVYISTSYIYISQDAYEEDNADYINYIVLNSIYAVNTSSEYLNKNILPYANKKDVLSTNVERTGANVAKIVVKSNSKEISEKICKSIMSTAELQMNMVVKRNIDVNTNQFKVGTDEAKTINVQVLSYTEEEINTFNQDLVKNAIVGFILAILVSCCLVYLKLFLIKVGDANDVENEYQKPLIHFFQNDVSLSTLNFVSYLKKNNINSLVLCIEPECAKDFQRIIDGLNSIDKKVILKNMTNIEFNVKNNGNVIIDRYVLTTEKTKQIFSDVENLKEDKNKITIFLVGTESDYAPYSHILSLGVNSLIIAIRENKTSNSFVKNTINHFANARIDFNAFLIVKNK